MVFSYYINCFIKLRSLVSAARSLLPLERERGRRGGERESTGESEKNMGLRRKMIFFFLNDGRKSINGGVFHLKSHQSQVKQKQHELTH
jgi:hypothetical protein